MSVKKTSFKQPAARPLPAAAESWVASAAADAEPTKPAARPAPGVKPARLTIDLPEELHTAFKSACARRRTRMVDEVRGFIEEWTQKNS
jgi:hypothetical protein